MRIGGDEAQGDGLLDTVGEGLPRNRAGLIEPRGQNPLGRDRFAITLEPDGRRQVVDGGQAEPPGEPAALVLARLYPHRAIGQAIELYDPAHFRRACIGSGHRISPASIASASVASSRRRSARNRSASLGASESSVKVTLRRAASSSVGPLSANPSR